MKVVLFFQKGYYLDSLEKDSFHFLEHHLVIWVLKIIASSIRTMCELGPIDSKASFSLKL